MIKIKRTCDICLGSKPGAKDSIELDTEKDNDHANIGIVIPFLYDQGERLEFNGWRRRINPVDNKPVDVCRYCTDNTRDWTEINWR